MKPGADAPATDDDGHAEQLAPPVVPGQRVGPEHRTAPDQADFGAEDPEQTRPAPDESAGTGLSAREQEILAFEQRWWKHAGAKEQAIRDTFDLSATRYYQLLNGLLDNPAALAAEPLLIGRLRRLRAARSRSRRR
ncbi:DUF3263 domain-containing protein [Micromonospora sp. NPDC050417]|uniref:DUF3263 domain-containing protein n=1 Tax=Micromonospora sp. NPDC050417 TaxID=3364280 RepID=UPI0037A7EB8D